MIYRVVISHRQSENIRKFPGDCSTMFVFDAPTGRDIAECTDHGCRYVIMQSAGNRGANRNAGLQKVLDTFHPTDKDYVEFFDGDRYPTTYRPEIVTALMERDNLQCVLYACSSDARLSKVYVPLSGATLVDTGTLCNPFYSCGFIMSVPAIRGLMEFGGGTLFEPRFTRWGSEDQYLGLVCDHLGYRVAMTCETILNGSVGGDSDMHEDYRESLQTYVDLIREHGFAIRNTPREPETINGIEK